MRTVAIVMLGFFASSCAWYYAQWDKDGPCVPFCVSKLDLPPISVLAEKRPDGTCRCEALDPDRRR